MGTKIWDENAVSIFYPEHGSQQVPPTIRRPIKKLDHVDTSVGTAGLAFIWNIIDRFIFNTIRGKLSMCVCSVMYGGVEV
jgi:hypothetical protein